MKKSLILVLIILAVVALIIVANQKTVVSPVSTPVPIPTPIVLSSPSTGTPSAVLGVQTKITGCQINGPFPDPACTPGAVFPNITKEEVCTSGYSTSVRDVPQSTKNKVFEEYGLPPTHHQPGEYEVDHFISLELGGSNDVSNLFPEAASPKPGFHEKDRYENFAHAQVCSGKITLDEAQHRISENWLKYWIEAGQP